MKSSNYLRALSGVFFAGLIFAAPLARTSAVPLETCQTSTALSLNLGLMRGHLLVAAELFEAGHYELAQRHSKHPAEEVYQELRPVLARLELQDFASELSSVAETLAKGEAGREQFPGRYAVLMRTMDALEARLPLVSQQQHSVAFELVNQAAYEYSVGVTQDGLVTDIQEYQDAYGFVTVAKSKLVDDSPPETEQLDQDVSEYLNAAMLLWPTLMPEGPLQVGSQRLNPLLSAMTQAGMSEKTCN